MDSVEPRMICSLMKFLEYSGPRTWLMYVLVADTAVGRQSLLFRLCFVAQVMQKSHDARQRLLRLGIFRKVEVVIDTSQGTAKSWTYSLTWDPVCSVQITPAFCLRRRGCASQWLGCDVWSDWAQKDDGQLQHHGGQQRRQHGQSLTVHHASLGGSLVLKYMT